MNETEVDPYAGIREALAPEHASLEADELTAVLGRMSARLVLHDVLNSPEMRAATVATLLGDRGRRTVRVNNADISIPVYLKMVSRLCREVAEESETGLTLQEQLIGPGGAPLTLSASVGRKGKNVVADVKLIQHLLNFNLPVPPKAIVESGTIDDDTIAAIQEFQRRILGMRTPDGVVDPAGQTFKSLAIDKFSFLPHRCQLLAGNSVPLDAAQMNPGFLTQAGVKRDAHLQDIVQRRILSVFPDLAKLRFALVDLTGDAKLASPQLAGNRETDQGGIGSISKLECMYGAYQLKFDLEELSRQRNITNQKALFDAARDLWNDTQKPDPVHVTTMFPSGPKIELQGKLVVVDGKSIEGVAGFSMPALEQIFTVAPAIPTGLSLMFRGSDRILVDNSVPAFPPNDTQDVMDYMARKGDAIDEVRKLSFAERLFLMIDASDNAAARSCKETVGFLYPTSVVWQSDFYSPARGGGIWEASSHQKDGPHWIKPPVAKPASGSDFISGTACSVAAIFTLLEQGRLVNRELCAGMLHLLNKRKPGGVRGGGFGTYSRSFFKEGLRAIPLDRIHSKLGIGENIATKELLLYDSALIARTVTDPVDKTKKTQIRYVAVGLDDSTRSASLLKKLVVELDKCICENNKLTC